MSPLLLQLGSAAALIVLMTLIHGAGVRRHRPWAGARPRAHQGPPAPSAHGGDPERGRPLAVRAAHRRDCRVRLVLTGGGRGGRFRAGAVQLGLGLTTLGQPQATFPLEWRLLGALEGLAGFLLLGWSTAFFVTDMNRLLRP